jgi:hypothetical protein
MGRNLTDEDIDAICHRLTEFSGLTPEEHRDHHNAFAEYISSQQRKAEFWDKMKQQLGGWMIISILSGIGYASWHGFVWAVSKGH